VLEARGRDGPGEFREASPRRNPIMRTTDVLVECPVAGMFQRANQRATRWELAGNASEAKPGRWFADTAMIDPSPGAKTLVSRRGSGAGGEPGGG